MFGFLPPRALKLMRMCRQLGAPWNQDADGTDHCQFDATAGFGLISMLADRDDMLYVASGCSAHVSLHAIPRGLGEFLHARNQCLSGLEWKVRNRGDYVRLSLGGVFAFSNINVMALASILNAVANEVEEMNSILAERGVLHV